MKLTDKQIDAITEEANSKEVIKLCEPNIAFPQTIRKWMVRRVLEACERVVK